MRKLFMVWLLFEVLISTRAGAQKKRFVDFFKDVLAIKEFKLNSSVAEVKKQKTIGSSMFMFSKEGNQSTYFAKDRDIPINEIGSFDDATLIFEHDKLSYINLELIDNGFGWQYKQAYQKFKGFYGEPETKRSKNNPIYSVYTWREGDVELKLRPLKISFMISYGRKIEQKKYWVQNDRKGKGNGSIQPNLSSLEKLATKGLTVSAFEGSLADWKSTGADNRIFPGLEFGDKSKIPVQFDITYQLNDFSVTISGKDTVSKIIEDYEFKKIKTPGALNTLKEDLLASGYKIGKKYPDLKGDIYFNQSKKISLLIDEKNKSVSIYYHKH